jgi:hypothetical protein
MKLKKVWFYLYRAVDSQGNTLEFLLNPTRDAEAAKRFFLKALHVPAPLCLLFISAKRERHGFLLSTGLAFDVDVGWFTGDTDFVHV